MVQLTAEGTSNTPREDLEALVRSLTRSPGTDQDGEEDAAGCVKEAARPNLLWAAYFKRSVADVPIHHSAIPDNVLVSQSTGASGSHLDLSRAPHVLYGVKYIDLVSLGVSPGQVNLKF